MTRILNLHSAKLWASIALDHDVAKQDWPESDTKCRHEHRADRHRENPAHEGEHNLNHRRVC